MEQASGLPGKCHSVDDWPETSFKFQLSKSCDHGVFAYTVLYSLHGSYTHITPSGHITWSSTSLEGQITSLLTNGSLEVQGG